MLISGRDQYGILVERVHQLTIMPLFVAFVLVEVARVTAACTR